MRAEGWVIKGHRLVSSRKIRTLYKDEPLSALWVYAVLRASVDSWGMMQGDPWTLKSELGKFDPFHGPDEYAAAVDELIEARLVYCWLIQGDPWLYVIGHEEENPTTKRSKHPIIPRPLLEEMNEWAASNYDNTEVQTNSRLSPDLVRTKFSENKLKEFNNSDVQTKYSDTKRPKKSMEGDVRDPNPRARVKGLGLGLRDKDKERERGCKGKTKTTSEQENLDQTSNPPSLSFSSSSKPKTQTFLLDKRGFEYQKPQDQNLEDYPGCGALDDGDPIPPAIVEHPAGNLSKADSGGCPDRGPTPPSASPSVPGVSASNEVGPGGCRITSPTAIPGVAGIASIRDLAKDALGGLDRRSSLNRRTDNPSGKKKPQSAQDGFTGASQDGTGFIADTRPISHEHAAIQELQTLHSDLWTIPHPTGPPAGDNLRRVLAALRTTRWDDFNGCKAAIYGHHKLAGKDGSPIGKTFRHVFPESRNGGKSMSNKLDEDRFWEFVAAGRSLVPDEKADERAADVERKQKDKADLEAAEFAKQAGIKPGDSIREQFRKAGVRV